MNYTMNYEKLYKSVLVKIQEALASTKDDHKISGLTRDCLENIFPELKENENERIRKVLIDYFQAYKEKKERGITTFNGIPTDNILAWLEKQGEQKPQGKTALEAVKEEKIDNQNCVKPSNNVEPKFHPGDWIIRNAEGFKHNTYLVKEVKDYYVCEELKGRRVTFTFNDVHNNFKLWDISDAKCGDVLISSPHKQPFVYNGNHTRDDIGAYFGLNYQGELLICDSHGNNWTELTGVQPATEEQCNTLFKKLHDSDYKWDGEKKELWHKYL